MLQQQITYGNSTIEYTLSFSHRKTLGIKVYPDKSVKVIAPINTTLEKVSEKVYSKAAWIINQQDFFLSFHPITPPRKFVSGETHLYLGKQYRLKVIPSNDEKVKLQGGNINVFTKQKTNKARIEKQLKEWYKTKATNHFSKMFDALLPIATTLTNTIPTLDYKWLNKRWGSCSEKGVILLNFELIKTPKKCIEYVLIHEICHLAHLNHSTAFYQLLEKHALNWQQTKNELEHLMV